MTLASTFWGWILEPKKIYKGLLQKNHAISIHIKIKINLRHYFIVILLQSVPVGSPNVHVISDNENEAVSAQNITDIWIIMKRQGNVECLTQSASCMAQTLTHPSLYFNPGCLHRMQHVKQCHCSLWPINHFHIVGRAIPLTLLSFKVRLEIAEVVAVQIHETPTYEWTELMKQSKVCRKAVHYLTKQNSSC